MMTQKVCLETGEELPKCWFFNYKPFLLQYAVAQWMPQNQSPGLAKAYADWNLESFNSEEVILVSSMPHQILYWLDKLFKLNWCCVLCKDKSQARFKPRLLSLTCSKPKQNVNSESTGNIMGFEQMRHVATIDLLMCVTKLHQCLQKLIKNELRVAQQGNRCFHCPLIGNKHTLAGSSPASLLDKNMYSFYPQGMVLNCFQSCLPWWLWL